MNAVIALIYLLIPLAYLPWFTNGFDLIKNTIFRSLILILIFSHGASFVLQNSAQIDKARFKKPISIVFLCLILLLIISTIFSPTPLVSFFGNYQRQLGLVSFLFIAILFIETLIHAKKKDFMLFAYSSFIAAGLIAFYAVLQKFGFNVLFQGFQDNIFEGRVYSTLGNPDFLAQFLAPILPIGVSLIFSAKTQTKKILLFITNLVIAIALIFAQSRASIIGLILGTIILLITSFSKRKKRSFSKKSIKITIGTLLIAGLIWGGITNFGLLKTDRFTINPTSIRSVQSRLSIWTSALNLIADHPLLGTGIDTFYLYFPQYANPDFYVMEEALNITADREHNEILQFGVWGGIPTMALYISLFILSLSLFLKTYKTLNPFGKGVFISFFTYFIQNLFTFSSLTHYVFLVFLLTGQIVLTQKKSETAYLKIKDSWKSILILPFGIFIAVIWNWTVLNPLVADAAYEKYLYFSQDEASMIKNLNEAISLAPYAGVLRYEMMMRSPENYMTSLEAMEKIEGETMDVLAWKGNALIESDFNAAMKYYLEAIAKNPDYPQLLRAIGDAYFRNHDCPKAITYYENFLDKAPPFWKWKDDLASRSEAEQKTYRIFFTKNETDFPTIFQHLVDCSIKLGKTQKVDFYSKYLKP